MAAASAGLSERRRSFRTHQITGSRMCPPSALAQSPKDSNFAAKAIRDGRGIGHAVGSSTPFEPLRDACANICRFRPNHLAAACVCVRTPLFSAMGRIGGQSADIAGATLDRLDVTAWPVTDEIHADAATNRLQHAIKRSDQPRDLVLARVMREAEPQHAVGRINAHGLQRSDRVENPLRPP